jgi:putative hydrolase of the HAD superfamily
MTGNEYTTKNVDWSELEAITFDVDANLYNYPRMMIPRLWKWGWYVRFLMHLTKARQIIRKEEPPKDFRKRQAEIIADLCYWLDTDQAYKKTEKVLYNGWNVDFKTVKPYEGTHEFIQKAVDNNIKIAVVTDYPPHKKLEYMGFKDYPWTTIVECEELGILKPAPEPFLAALEAFDLKDSPERVMHIGDSYNYDVKGASRVGMKTAWLRRKWRFSKMPWGEEDLDKITPDVIFKDWDELGREMERLCGWK